MQIRLCDLLARSLIVPKAECCQFPGQQAPLKSSIDLDSIVVRERHKLVPWLCGEKRVPAELKCKLYCLCQVAGFVTPELMTGGII